MLKSAILSLIRKLGYDVLKIRPPRSSGLTSIPDADLYLPLFSPWFGKKNEFARYYKLASPKTLVSADRCHVLYSLLRQAILVEGDVWECGVYRGGTAAMMAAFLKDNKPSKKLYLFDTFEGMPDTDSGKDVHEKGDLSDTNVDTVTAYVGCPEICVVRKGFIPDTFAGLESAKIALAHIDVDIYQSILDSLAMIWPRLTPGGFIVFDDYGFPSCPGARAAVDEFFAGKPSVPLCLPTGQAVIFKGAAS